MMGLAQLQQIRTNSAVQLAQKDSLSLSQRMMIDENDF
jgi:hypothetical protein